MTTDVKVLIAEFLRTHKRLVVPQLGAFIVKAPGGEILFSELFKRDDGVLRGLLTAAGASEIEAAGAIDRLIFDLRHAVQHGGVYLVAGLAPGHRGFLWHTIDHANANMGHMAHLSGLPDVTNWDISINKEPVGAMPAYTRPFKTPGAQPRGGPTASALPSFTTAHIATCRRNSSPQNGTHGPP